MAKFLFRVKNISNIATSDPSLSSKSTGALMKALTEHDFAIQLEKFLAKISKVKSIGYKRVEKIPGKRYIAIQFGMLQANISSCKIYII